MDRAKIHPFFLFSLVYFTKKSSVITCWQKAFENLTLYSTEMAFDTVIILMFL